MKNETETPIVGPGAGQGLNTETPVTSTPEAVEPPKKSPEQQLAEESIGPSPEQQLAEEDAAAKQFKPFTPEETASLKEG